MGDPVRDQSAWCFIKSIFPIYAIGGLYRSRRSHCSARPYSATAPAASYGRIEMAAADIAKCRDGYQDGEAVRERDSRLMVDAERDCRPGADEDQCEGADELGGQSPHRTGCCFSHRHLQTRPGERISPPLPPTLLPLPNTMGLAITYEAGYRGPVNLSKSWKMC